VDSQRENTILNLVEQARLQSDALIVVGILPGGRIFHSCDPRLPLPDLHGALRDNLDFICESVAHHRARKTKERSRS
jgi:hypothetical protein